MPIHQSVCYPMMKPSEISQDLFLKNIAEIGFPAVELWGRGSDFKEWGAMARGYGLTISQMMGHTTLSSGFNDPAQHPRILEELRESIDIASDWGIPGLICFSGNRREGQSDIEAISVVVEGLKKAAVYAEAKGINLNMELLNSKVDHPGYLCDHTEWGLAVCKLVNSPRVKLLYDIYHMQIMEGDVIRTITQNIQWIGHFHTAGITGRKDIDESQELNYSAVCKAIAQTNYDLYLGHEYQPHGDVFTSLKKTFNICQVD